MVSCIGWWMCSDNPYLVRVLANRTADKRIRYEAEGERGGGACGYSRTRCASDRDGASGSIGEVRLYKQADKQCRPGS